MIVHWIEASAGCGKTTFLLEKYKRNPCNSLFITFSNAAAEELKHRLNSADVLIMTLHSFAHNLLKSVMPINQVTDQNLENHALSILLQDKAIYELFEWLHLNSDGIVEEAEVSSIVLNQMEPTYNVAEINAIYSDALLDKASLDKIKLVFFTKQSALRKKIKIPNLDSNVDRYDEYIDQSLKRLEMHERFLNCYILKIKNQLYQIVKKKEQELKSGLGLVSYNDLILEASKLIQHSGESLFKFIGNIKNFYIDEAQDLSKDQLALILHILNEWNSIGENLYIAGDSKQLIYEFQGASLAKFYAFKEKLKVLASDFQEVFLNTTYRLSKNICDFVNEIGNTLDINYVAHSTQNQVLGEVLKININQLEDVVPYITNDCMILCKTKHTDVKKFAISLMKKGFLLNSPFILEHPIIKDFQHLLRWLLYKNKLSLGVIFRVFDKQNLSYEEMSGQPEMELLGQLSFSSVSQLFQQWIGLDLVESFLQLHLQNSFDYFVDILRRYADFYEDAPYEAIFDLHDFFSNNTGLFEKGVFLNTIHAAKGKEAKRVILLDIDRKSRFKNDTDRLLYVALTRAKEELIIV